MNLMLLNQPTKCAISRILLIIINSHAFYYQIKQNNRFYLFAFYTLFISIVVLTCSYSLTSICIVELSSAYFACAVCTDPLNSWRIPEEVANLLLYNHITFNFMRVLFTKFYLSLWACNKRAIIKNCNNKKSN